MIIKKPSESTLPTYGYMRLPQILELIPVSSSGWWAKVKLGIYPQPVKLSPRCTAWKCEDIKSLINSINNQSKEAV